LRVTGIDDLADCIAKLSPKREIGRREAHEMQQGPASFVTMTPRAAPRAEVLRARKTPREFVRLNEANRLNLAHKLPLTETVEPQA
jgi:hypothetical protein